MRKHLLSLFLCGLCAIGVARAEATLVLNEGFEGGSLPQGWTVETDANVNAWAVQNAAAAALTGVVPPVYEGDYCLVAPRNEQSGKGVARVITPAMNLRSVNQPQLVFHRAQRASSGRMDTLSVYYRLRESDTWHLLKKFSTSTNGGWLQESVALGGAAATAQTYQIAFEIQNNASRGVLVDNVVVMNSSICQDVSDIQITADADKAQLYCNGTAGSDGEYLISTRKMGTPSATNAAVVASGAFTPMTPNTITGLNPNTSYYIYLRTTCSDNISGYTNWVEATFKTRIRMNVPYSENFDAAVSKATYGVPFGWTFLAGTEDGVAPYVVKTSKASYLVFAGEQSTTPDTKPLEAGLKQYAVSPQINITSYDSLQLEFDATVYGAYGADFAASLKVGLAENPENLVIDELDVVSFDKANQKKHVVVSLHGYTGHGTYLVLYSDFSKKNFFAVDNLSLKKTNIVPNHVALSQVNAKGFTVSADLHGASAWNLRVFNVADYVTGDTLPAVAPLLALDNQPAGNVVVSADTLSGKAVLVYAQAVYANGVSKWSFPVVTVLSDTLALPATYNFTSLTGTYDLASLTKEYVGDAHAYVPELFFASFDGIKATVGRDATSQRLNLNGVGNYIISPIIDSLQNRSVVFQLYGESAKVRLALLSDPSDLASAVELKTFSAANTVNGERCTYYFDEYQGALTAGYVMIQALRENNQIDNLTFANIPALRIPLNVQALAAEDSATLSWDANGMNFWHIALADEEGKVRYNTELFSEVYSEVNSLTVKSLTPAAKYYFGVEASLADSSRYSESGKIYSFVTKAVVPYVAPMDAAHLAAWTQATGDYSNVLAGTEELIPANVWSVSSITNYGFAASQAVSTAKAAFNWLISPKMTLPAASASEHYYLSFPMALTGDVNNISQHALYVLASTNDGQTWSLVEHYGNLSAHFQNAKSLHVDLASLAGQTVQLAIVVGAAEEVQLGYRIGQIEVAPLNDACLGVTDFKCESVSTSFAKLVFHANGNQLFDIFYFTAEDPSDTIFVREVADTTYMVYDLLSNTKYTFAVRQTCGIDPVWDKLEVSVPLGLPFVEPLTSGTLPEGWEKMTGLMADAFAGTAPSTTASGWTLNSTYGGFSPADHYKVNVYGTSCKYWLVSPEFVMEAAPEDSIFLTFDLALTKYNSNDAPIEISDDDKFAVLVSTDNGASWSAADAFIWASDSSTTRSYRTIPNVATSQKLDLTQYKGQSVRIAFYGESTASGGDNDVHIGNVAVRKPNPNCMGVSGLTVSNLTTHSAIVSWTATGSDEVRVQVAKQSSFAPASLIYNDTITESSISLADLKDSTTYYVRVAQMCSPREWSQAQFMTYTKNLSESFASSNWPANWQRLAGTSDMLFGGNCTSTTSGWGTSSYPGNGLPGNHAGCEIYSTSYNYWMVSPVVMIESAEGEGKVLTFDMALTYWSSAAAPAEGSTDDRVWVVISEDAGATWSPANATLWSANPQDPRNFDYYSIPTTGKRYKINLAKYEGKAIAIAFGVETSVSGTDNRLHVANVKIESVDASCMGLTALQVTNVQAHAATLAYVAGGTQVINYTLATDANFQNVVTSAATTEEAAGVLELTDLEANTLYYIRARQACGAESDTLYASFKTPCDAVSPIGYAVNFLDDNYQCWTYGFAEDGNGGKAERTTTPRAFGAHLQLAKTAVNTSTTAYADGAYAISPELLFAEDDTISHYQVVFNAATYANSLTNNPVLKVGVLSDLNDQSTFEAAATIKLAYAADSLSMPQYVVSLASYAGDYMGEFGKYVQFVVTAGADSTADVRIDNIRLEPAVDCQQILSTSVTDVATTSAVFRWDAVDAAEHEVILASIRTFRPDTIAEPVAHLTVAVDSVAFTGLTPATFYYAYVRGVCSETEASVWSTPAEFSTAYGIPFLETFDAFDRYPQDKWHGYRGANLVENGIFDATSATVNTSSATGWYCTAVDSRISGMETKAARVEMYGSSYNAVLTSPSLLVEPSTSEDSTGVHLTFKAAAVPYSSSTPSLADAKDYALTIMVSDDEGRSFHSIASWKSDMTGDFDFNAIKSTAVVGDVDLSDYVGKRIQVAFFTSGVTAAPDTYFFIDSVAISYYDNSCVRLTNLVAEVDTVTAQLSWKRVGGEQAVITVATDKKFENVVATHTVAADSLVLNNLEFNTTYYVRGSLSCGGDTAVTSFTTPHALSGLQVALNGDNAVDLAWEQLTNCPAKVEVAFTSDFSPATLVYFNDNVTTTSLSVSDFEFEQQYFVRITLACASDTLTGRFKTSVDHSKLFLYESFNVSSVPSDWTIWTGAPSAAFAGTNPTSSSYGWTITTSSNGLPANHLKINIYSSTNNRWIMSPSVNVGALPTNGDSIAFSFDFAYTNYASASAIDAGSDQALMLLVSTDDGTTWTQANSWEWSHSDASAAVKFPLVTSGTMNEHYSLNFNQFAGQTVKFAFVALSTSQDNDFHIANVRLGLPEAVCASAASNVEASDLTSHSANLSWTGDAALRSVVEISSVSDFSRDLIHDTVASGLTYAVENLKHSTTYYVRVKQICADGLASAYTKAVSFMTDCLEQTLPWTESFETYATGNSSSPAMPCWEYVNFNEGTYPYAYVNTSSSYVHSGSKSLYFQSSASVDGYVILPAMDAPTNRLLVDFYYKHESTSSSGRTYLGYVMGNMFYTIAECERSTSWVHASADLTSLPDSIGYARLAFRYAKQSANYYLGIDDIHIVRAPFCPKPDPAFVLEDKIARDSAVIAWPSTGADKYLLTLASATDTIRAEVQDTCYAIKNLQPSTNYTFTVSLQGVCQDTSLVRTSTIVFATACAEIDAAQWKEGFENAFANELPNCWSAFRGDRVYVRDNASNAHAGSKSLYFYGTGDSSAVMAVLPEFVQSLDTMYLDFYYKSPENTSRYAYDTLYVGVMSDPYDSTTFVVLDTIAQSASYTHRYVEFGAAPAGYNYIALCYNGGKTQGALYIDDLQLLPCDYSKTIDTLIVSNVERRSFDTKWFVNSYRADNHSYEVVVSATQLDAAALEAAAKTVVTDTTGYHAQGLERDTDYYFYVRSTALNHGVAPVWASAKVHTQPMLHEEELTVGSGTSSETGLPSNVYYNYGYSEQIYTPEEIGAKGIINSIAFYPTFTSGSGKGRNLVIYMAHTDKSEFTSTSDWVGAAGADMVASTTISYVGNQWNVIELSAPFEYNGTDNLLVIVDDNTGDYDSSSKYFRTFSAGSNQALYMNNDYNNQDPMNPTYAGTRTTSKNQLKFAMMVPADACPELTGLSAELTGNKATSASIKWNESTADYLGSIQVVYADSMLKKAVLDTITPMMVVDDGALSVELTGLNPLTKYYAYVRSICDGEGHNDGMTAWQSVSFTTLDFCHVPANLQLAVAAIGEVDATWDATDQPNAYQYIVSLDTIAAADLATAVPTVTGIDTTYAHITGLLPDTVYHVYVANTFDGHTSAYIHASVRTPLACPAVAAVQADVTLSNAVQISWTSDRVGVEEEWEVGVVGDEAFTATVTTRNYLFLALEADSLYTFYVKALCGEGSESPATSIKVRTKKAGGAAGEGDNLIIGEEAGTTNSNAPVYGMYMDDGMRSQMIYPASLLEGLVGRQIMGMKFFVSGTGSNAGKWDNTNFKGYIGTTTQPDLSTAFVPQPATNIFDGVMAVNTVDNMVITFPEPFLYSGDNLVIEFNSDGGAGYASVPFVAFASPYGTRYTGGSYSNGTANSLPTVEFTLVAQSAGNTMAAPVNVAISEIATTSAHASWLPGGPETDWTYVVSESPLDDQALNYSPAVQRNTVNREVAADLTGLNADTDYYFYIRADKGSQHSDWLEKTFTTLPTCLVPVNFQTVEATETSATIAWENPTPDFAGDYTVLYGLASAFDLENAATYTTVEATDTAVLITGLKNNTKYTMVVIGNCDEQSHSRHSAPYTFVTDCGFVTELPWMENFDSYSAGTFLEQCWVNEHVSGSGYYLFSISTSTNADNTTHQLQLPDMTAGTITRLTLPTFVFERAYGAEFSLDVYRNATGTSSPAEGIRVIAIDEDSVEYDLGFVSRNYTVANGMVSAEAASGWYNYQFMIPFAGQGHIVIQGESQYGLSTYMDNFQVRVAPSCMKPRDLQVTEATTTEASFKWFFMTGYAGTIQLATDADFTDIVLTQNYTGEDSTMTVTDLTPGTSYYVRMQNVCSEEEVSDYVRTSFVTMSAMPFFENFQEETVGNEEESATLPFWLAGSALAEDVFKGKGFSSSSAWLLSTTGDGFSGDHIRVNIYGTTRHEWLISPEISLGEDDSKSVSMSFDLAYTKWSTATAPTSYGDDDKFMVLVSTDNGATWSPDDATVWANDGTGDYAISDIPVMATRYAIDFSKYAGQNIRVAFYGESTVSNADNDFHIDNVRINEAIAVEVNGAICSGESWYDPTHIYSMPEYPEAGEYTFSGIGYGLDEGASDTIYTLHLHVGQSVDSVITTTYCYSETEMHGDEFGFQPFLATEPGVVYRNLTTASGCDSTITLVYNVIMPVEAEVFDTICVDKLPYQFGELTLMRSGTYQQTFISAETQCDSIATLHLYVDENCAGDALDDIYVGNHAQLVVNPNPVAVGEAFTIEGANESGVLTIYSAQGAMVDTYRFETLPAEVPGINAAGIYLLRYTTANGAYETKLLVH